MEAMLNLEDKWNLTTQQALLLFACTAFALIGLCTATMLKRKAHRKQMANQDPAASDTYQLRYNNWVRIRRMLMEAFRWSKANKWEEKRVGNLGETSPLPPQPQPQPLLGFEDCESSVSFDLGSQSHNSVSPVWQRPILMGEKCELPRFSGLILYDERGRLLHHSLASAHKENLHHEKRAAVLKTTLRDLL
ncbi:uncharacterized protein LOC110610789 [Manihot esculenta]|uniref:Uncharacterized protein n=1 Tax=Manihot esculenta TaxID=3983 RepID=A0A2C9W7N0_MANES|nr:uncharacterized protein LOC110610789 [Manihot esculenta]OAY54483.1 hypothetical protein MANES_03G078700v8 [Manihot esculenta]